MEISRHIAPYVYSTEQHNIAKFFVPVESEPPVRLEEHFKDSLQMQLNCMLEMPIGLSAQLAKSRTDIFQF